MSNELLKYEVKTVECNTSAEEPNSRFTVSLQSTNSACPVKLLSNQCLLLMLYLPSLASISRQDFAGNSGMEPKGTERLRGIFESKFRCYGLLSVKSSA